MTAPAAAAASGPIGPVTPRAAPQPPADRFAFAAVLDSLPSTPGKPGASTAEEQAHPSNRSAQDASSRGQNARHSPLNDSALLASLPFALRAASMGDERPQAPDNSPTPTSPATKAQQSEDAGASLASSATTPAVGRLVGERAFHVSAPAFTGAIASLTLAVDAPFAPAAVNFAARPALNGESALAASFSPAEATPAKASAATAPAVANAVSATPVGTRNGASPTHRVAAARAAAHEAMSSVGKPDVAAPPPVARMATSATVHAPAESSSVAADGRPPDATTLAAPLTPQTGLFGGPVLAPFAAGTFQLDGSAASAGQTDVAPRTTAPAAAPTSTAPIKEIDVDLSPGGLEDVSMTMRLAGDKLSVVIRAASSQTLGSIEGARDAIADRMAAIGQPLDSLVVKQMGVNTDGNANGNASSADGGSAGSEQRSAQGAGERGGSNDADWSRRGAGRDRSF
jgi:hypothetical protein